MERRCRRLKTILSVYRIIDDAIEIILSYFDVELYHRWQWIPRNLSGESFRSRGVCYLPDNRVIVLDKNRGYIFTQNGKLLGRWGTARFHLPLCIAPISNEEIAITDTNNRVIIFSSEGRYLRQWGRYGREAGEFNQPMGVCCVSSPGKQNEIVVADTYNHRIQFFTLEGKFIRQCGRYGSGEKEFSYPQGITTRRDEIIVADTCNIRIQVLSRRGKFLRQWGQLQHYGIYGQESYQPTGVALLNLPGKEYRVVVTDTNYNRVQIYSSAEEGLLLSQWKWEKLLWPKGITITPAGNIAMNVSNGDQIQIVGAHLC